MAFFKKKKEEILADKTEQFVAVAVGEVQAVDNAPDAVFSQKMMGDGVVFIPREGYIYACMDAEVTMLFPTKHAVGLKSKDGIEVLIHVGLDTVELEGKPFQVHVEVGQKVKAGDLLMEVDLAMIEAAGKSIYTPVIVTNAEELENYTFVYDVPKTVQAKEVYGKVINT